MTTLGRSFWPLLLLTACLALLPGCSSIGPGTVARDRFDYSTALADSWKRQALLNIVKLRYVDPPVQLEVGQVVAGYSLETGVSVGGDIPSGGDSELSLGTAGKYTDRPTITYQPLTGAKYIRASMMPLPPESIFFLIQAGWPADGVLFSAVSAINGLKNQQATLSGVTAPNPEFLRVLELLRKLQDSGAVAMRIQQDKEKQQTTLLGFPAVGIKPETLEEIAELRRALKLDAETHEFRLVFGATQANNREIAVLTRSMVHIMAMLSAYAEVPPEHVAEGRATPGVAGPGPLRIRCSEKRPADAATAVAYRKHWFWIDDRDLKTKRAFALLMMFSSLADTEQREPTTLITIPAQ